jgi:hypothetical protein
MNAPAACFPPCCLSQVFGASPASNLLRRSAWGRRRERDLVAA